MAERVLVVGCGLIGGSIGLALRRAGAAFVRGVDRDDETARRAAQVGALDEAATDLETAGADVDVIVVATPVGQILPVIGRVAGVARPGTVVTDVGSAKGGIVAEAMRLLGPQRPFVGGHPMAGSEREGIDAAREDLFDGALWLLTPVADTDAGAYRRVNALVAATGARALALDPGQHDRIVAVVSHLPYLIATTLLRRAAEVGDERVFRAAAGSFRDVTRTGGTSPRVWRDILAANAEAIVAELDAYVSALGSTRDAVARGEWETIDDAIARARDARRRLPLKGERAPVEPWLVEVPVRDRAGALAELTTALGEIGVNIEDLWIDHQETGGVVRIVVDGRPAAERSAARLREIDYHPVALPMEA